MFRSDQEDQVSKRVVLDRAFPFIVVRRIGKKTLEDLKMEAEKESVCIFNTKYMFISNN